MLQQKRNLRTAKSNIKNQIKLICQLFCLVAKVIFSNRSIRFSLLCTIFVWTVWLTAIGPSRALSNLFANWEFAFTMVFGSMVAGATSMGGGAVAFPALTKWLHVSPPDAKLFSLAIQSIGMSAASFTIVAMKTPVEWKLIRWVSLGGIPGIFMGTAFLAPLLPPEVIKISFTMMVSSFALILIQLNLTKTERNFTIEHWGKREKILSLVVGVMGGMISGLVGSGMDVFAYSVMVLLFGLCEKVSTPTSVILMAINAVTGFLIHNFILGDFVTPVSNYWLAAVPVVVVGAPTGAILCSLMERQMVVGILISLIVIELLTSLLLIPLTTSVVSAGLFALILFTSFYYLMYRTKLRRA
ncbi:sulfite exporter TauE/SafE family protein [Moorena sp. SIO3B2]|uniref:sulfite exporter TauE/SafE family protein n=1 Tax=Moorena sp. SIO3B2 TaxID=2607827 RepID=UPI0013CC84D9|nr:sulfite exporter TauE/SafE family protein [Moorena sp. SIO3B2]NEP34281.1 sulfite exporter TauE/SafE family protein [Moorena sp. SIO3B2]